MKRFFNIAACTIVTVILSVLTACSQLNGGKTGTIIFGMGGGSSRSVTGQRTALSDALADYPLDIIYLDFAISGDYSAQQTEVSFETAANEGIKFENIPVGAVITCSCVVYMKKDPLLSPAINLYKGTSESVTVIPGANTVDIQLSSVDSSDTGNDDDTPITYTVNISEGIENGTVFAKPYTATANETVTLILSANDGYEIGTYTVKDADGNNVLVNRTTTVGEYTFTMPESNVTVTATFTLTILQTPTLADIFLDGSVTTIKFNDCFGAQSATFENNDGTFSITSGASHWNDENNHDYGTASGVREITQEDDTLTIRYGYHDSDSYDTVFTFNTADNTYSITDSGYFEVSDITALEVNGVDIKNTLTKN